MSIVVTSNQPVEQTPTEAKLDGGKEAQSAQDAKEAPEQNEATESDTEATEVKEAKDESQDEDADEADESKDESEAKDEKPKKKGGFQRRIDKLNREKAAARQEAEYWKQQALKGASESKPESKVETPKAADPAGKPKPEDFETHAEYVEALTDWKVDQREKAREAKDQKSKLQSEHETRMQAHTERVKAFAEKTPDWEDSLAEVEDIQFSAAAIEAITSSEKGPELIYELAKNREEAERIAKLPPLAAARELGRLEARIAARASEAKKPEPKKTTQAPKPVTPPRREGCPGGENHLGPGPHSGGVRGDPAQANEAKERLLVTPAASLKE